MTVINTNVGALMARTYATKANDKMQTSMERLSSGMRINSAADDAAGLAVANKMTSQLSGIKMAIRNSQDGISLVQTAESGMGEITNMILRMRELAVQMENGIYTAKDRDNAQLEVNALLAEVDKIANNTRFNDVKVLDGSYDQTIRAGNTNAETIRVNVGSLKTADNAKIEIHALDHAIVDAGGVSTDGTDTDLQVNQSTQAKITTLHFSTALKDILKGDSLGTFSLATAAAGATADNTVFSIDAKTGELTSRYILDHSSSVEWGGANGLTSTADDVAFGSTIGESIAGSKVFSITVNYKTRAEIVAGTAGHNEVITLTLEDYAETQLEDIKVETTADASRAVETLDKALEEVSTAQAKLGAIQNRLSHNIDNLSKGYLLTEQSV